MDCIKDSSSHTLRKMQVCTYMFTCMHQQTDCWSGSCPSQIHNWGISVVCLDQHANRCEQYQCLDTIHQHQVSLVQECVWLQVQLAQLWKTSPTNFVMLSATVQKSARSEPERIQWYLSEYQPTLSPLCSGYQRSPTLVTMTAATESVGTELSTFDIIWLIAS